MLASRTSLYNGISEFFLCTSDQAPALAVRHSCLCTGVSYRTKCIDLTQKEYNSRTEEVLILLQLKLHSRTDSSLLFLLFENLTERFSLSGVNRYTIVFHRNENAFYIQHIHGAFKSTFTFIRSKLIDHTAIHQDRMSFSFFPDRYIDFFMIVFIFFRFLHQHTYGIFCEKRNSCRTEEEFLTARFQVVHPSNC